MKWSYNHQKMPVKQNLVYGFIFCLAASNQHLALRSCLEIMNYCVTATSGFFELKSGDGSKQVWCDFERKEGIHFCDQLHFFITTQSFVCLTKA